VRLDVQPWKPSFTIGVTELDAQHHALFERAAIFETAVMAGEPAARLFGYLATYVSFHFEAEERLMREIEYPRLEEHAREHADVKRRLQSLAPLWESEGNSAGLRLALTGFLDLWMADDVTSSDQAIGDYLRERAGLPSLRSSH
jgi:hemerythrin